MTFISLLTLIAGIGDFCLGAIVLKKGRHREVNVAFASLAFLISLWVFVNFIVGIVSGMSAGVSPLSLFLLRTTYALGIIIPSFFVVFFLTFSRENINKKHVRFLYLSSIPFILIAYTTFLIKKVDFIYHATFEGEIGVLFPVWGMYLIVLVLYGAFIMCQSHKQATGIRRLQIKYMCIGSFTFAFIATAVTIILPLFGNLKWSYLDAPSSLLIVGFIAYAIAKHRLLDIEVVISKTVLFFLLTGSIFALYIVLVGLFLKKLDYIPATIFSISLIVFIYFFTPFRQKLTKRVEDLIYRDKYQHQKVLYESSQLLVGILDLNQVLHSIVAMLTDNLKLEKVALFLKERQSYVIKTSFGLEGDLKVRYSLDRKTIRWLKEKKDIFFFEEEVKVPVDSRLKKNDHFMISLINPQAAVPLFFRDELLGILVLGRRQGGRENVQSDLDLLKTLSVYMAVAIKNAQLYTDIVTDPLTQLYNYEYLRKRISGEIERSKREERPLSLMVLEVSARGEKGSLSKDLLVNIGKILRANTRIEDLVAHRRRKRGVFDILLPDTSRDISSTPQMRWRKHLLGMMIVAKRLKERIARHNLHHDSSSKNFSIDIGISSFSKQEGGVITQKELISSAEQALVQAKQGSRGGIEMFGIESVPSVEPVEEEKILTSGKIRIFLDKHIASINDKPIHLTPKEFDLLCVFLRKKSRVLKRDFLLDHVWGYAYSEVTTRTIDVHVRNLRRKLGREGKKITTVGGVGYKFLES